MGDKLKQFIEDNRDAFDSESPAPKVLQKLKRELGQDSPPKKLFQPKFMHWAAAVLGLLIVSIILYYTMQKGPDRGVVEGGPVKPDEIAVSDPIYAKQIDRYQELIGLQQNELRQVEKEQPELYRQFSSDIDQLDSAYIILRKTLNSNPNKEMLLEAMISNLQLQTELLNRQLSIIKEIKQKSKA
jgi:hypothetical protein